MGASVARIATHCTEADIADPAPRTATRPGDGDGRVPDDGPHDRAGRAAAAGADHGGRRRAVRLRRRLGGRDDDARTPGPASRRSRTGLDAETQVGIHAHNNLALSVANSIAALEEGVDQVDGCARGLGAGAGNCPTEILVAVCEKAGYPTGVDPLAIMDVAEDVVAPIMRRPQLIDRDGLTLGYAGVYSLVPAPRGAGRRRSSASDAATSCSSSAGARSSAARRT